MLSLENLRCFVEAARLLNFRAAARAAALTPAALGNRVRQLEAQLGCTLFVRTTRRVTLTSAGLALVPHARRALDAAADCERAGRGRLEPAPIELTVGTRFELGMSWIVPMRARLRAASPGLTVHFSFGSAADLLARVRAVEIDCAVGSMRPTDPKLTSLRLHREDFVFVGQPALLRKTPLRRPPDAARHTLIDTLPDLPLYRFWRDAQRAELRLAFGGILRMGTTAAIRELVLAGEGVAVLPRYLVEPDLRAKRLTRVLPGTELLSDSFRLIFRSDDPRSALYETLAQTMRRQPLR